MMTENENLKVNNEELEAEQKRKVFIGSLSYRIDENTFREYWTKFGTVLDATILRDREGRSRGFGFVTFDNSSCVDAVMQARPHTLDNRVVEPKRAVPREDSNKPNMQLAIKKIYLGGIKEPLAENDLKDYFSKYGNISNVTIMKDRDGQYRGFGFVEFDDYDPVDKIILEKNHIVCGRALDVQKAQTKDGSQRSGGNSGNNMRSRQGPPPMSRPNYDSGYDNYQQNSFNGSYGQMPNSNNNNDNYNDYNPNFNGGNYQGAPFGQGYGQESFSGPMRRGNMRGGGGGHGNGPYNGRGGGGGGGGRSRGGRGGRGGGPPPPGNSSGNQGPSWSSWH